MCKSVPGEVCLSLALLSHSGQKVPLAQISVPLIASKRTAHRKTNPDKINEACFLLALDN